LTFFSKLHQRSTLLFLQTYPTPEVALAASQQQIALVLKKAGHPTAEPVAAEIFQTLHQPHLMADAITTRTKARLMQVLIKPLLPLLEEIAAYDKEIARLFLRHEDKEVFSSLPRAGKRLAPRLLAEIGDDRERSAHSASLQALAGTAPVPSASGTSSKPHRRYACIKPLRNALQQFAWQRTQSEAWAQDYSQRQRKEGKSHSEAVRALAKVWVRIIFAIWNKKERYQTSIFATAQRLHAKPAA